MKRGGSYKNSKRQGRQREVFINGLLPVGEIIQKKFPEQFQSNAEKKPTEIHQENNPKIYPSEIKFLEKRNKNIPLSKKEIATEKRLQTFRKNKERKQDLWNSNQEKREEKKKLNKRLQNWRKVKRKTLENDKKIINQQQEKIKKELKEL